MEKVQEVIEYRFQLCKYYFTKLVKPYEGEKGDRYFHSSLIGLSIGAPLLAVIIGVVNVCR
ncbi:hypothetical protein [Virgibacillus salexigens]|uniref:hypothetical protein n=1 Tax=Virgibacillus salexigens TaxID=61016 RepID=UPI001909179A|nr:hypothetical protein [Virgibacillus salexigens]